MKNVQTLIRMRAKEKVKYTSKNYESKREIESWRKTEDSENQEVLVKRYNTRNENKSTSIIIWNRMTKQIDTFGSRRYRSFCFIFISWNSEEG